MTARTSSYSFLEAGDADAIRNTGTALVEHDEARERSQAPEVSRLVAVLPLQLEVRDEGRHVDDVDGAVAEYLIRDVHIAATGLVRLGWLHGCLPPSLVPPISPGNERSPAARASRVEGDIPSRIEGNPRPEIAFTEKKSVRDVRCLHPKNLVYPSNAGAQPRGPTLAVSGCPVGPAARVGLLDFVGVAAVPNPNDVDHSLAIVQAVHDSVVPHAHAPQNSRAPELARADRSWIFRQRLDSCDEPADDRWIEGLQFLPC